MSDARIVKLEDLTSLITKERGEDPQQVKIIIEEDGQTALYTIEYTRTVIPF